MDGDGENPAIVENLLFEDCGNEDCTDKPTEARPQTKEELKKRQEEKCICEGCFARQWKAQTSH